jgi:hypothetical protein
MRQTDASIFIWVSGLASIRLHCKRYFDWVQPMYSVDRMKKSASCLVCVCYFSMIPRPFRVRFCDWIAECLAAEAELATSEAGLLNRGGLFTDAMALCAIWPVEMDNYRLIVCQVRVRALFILNLLVWDLSCVTQLHSDDTLLYYNVFEPEHGPHDDSGQWVGKDIIMTNQVIVRDRMRDSAEVITVLLQDGHFTLLAPEYGKPLVNATILIAHAAQAAAENPNMANVMTYLVSVKDMPRRYGIRDVVEMMNKAEAETEEKEHDEGEEKESNNDHTVDEHEDGNHEQVKCAVHAGSTDVKPSYIQRALDEASADDVDDLSGSLGKTAIQD